MKITVKRSVIVGIAILQCQFWIVLNQEAFKAFGANDSEDDGNSSTGEEPKTVQDENTSQTTSLIFISSSFLTIATSSVLEVKKDNFLHSIHYPFISGTAVLADDDSLSLLNTSIQDSLTDETSNHQSYLSTPHVVDVPSSYLLNSSYLLKSHYLSENSFYLLGNLSSHNSDINEYHVVSSSSIPQIINLYSSSIYQSLPEKGVKEVPPITISEDIKPIPTAESRVFTMTNSHVSSSKFVTVDSNKLTEDDSVFRGKEIRASSAYNYNLQDDKESYSIKDKNLILNENEATLSLSEGINTDFSNFFIETRSTLAVSSFSEDSTKLSSQTVSHDKISNLEEPDSLLMSHSVLTTLVEEVNDSNKSYSHEIISDDTSEKNKTFRNEDGEIDDIISGIIHLLAGNVKVARPANKGFGLNPTRLHLPLQPSLVSTRINNRGPIRPNSYSRTVVVFSQPPNKGHPTELALPGHFVPSTLQNPQFIRIRPSKVGEQPPSAVSVIHFYNQGPKHPNNPPSPQIPFRGEVFNSNPKPNNNVRITTFPNENVRPSFLNPVKSNVFSGNPLNKYPHFIFSDQSASPVVVIHPSKPPLAETFEKFSPELQNKEHPSNKISPSQSFEVLIDDTTKKKIFINQADIPSNSYSSLNMKEVSDNQKSLGAKISPTSVGDIPHGPVTDWVPFAERPSKKDNLNETSSLKADKNVSIIMRPVIFDIPLSSFVNEELNFKSSTFNPNFLTSVVTEATTSINEQSMVSPETLESPSVSKTEYFELISSVISEEYLQSNNLLTKIENTFNVTKQVSDTSSMSSIPLKTVDISSTPTLSIAQINDYSKTEETVNSSNINMISSYNKDIRSSFTEKRAFVENTESTTFSLNPTDSTPTPTQTFKTTPTDLPSEATEKTLLGRPIVIPVDIEDVRPFVGPINPPGSERNRDNSYQGSVFESQGSATEESVRIATSSTTRTPIIRSQGRPRPNTIRIDTCIVGDDSTCDTAYNETCKMEMGISSCHCRPGYARSYTRGPCIQVVSLMLSMKIDRIGTNKVTFSHKYLDKNTEDYRLMEFEAKQALTTLISQIPAFSRTFQGMRINTFYPIGEKLVVNSTIFLEEKESTRTQAVRLRLRQLIGEAIRNRKQNIGESRLYVEGSYNPVTAIEDVNECSDSNLNDCSADGTCFNVFGTYLCKCRNGYVDPFVHDERRSGRKCSACSPEYCSFHGRCFVERDKRLCKCHGNYIGSRCEIDGEVLGVALGASLAAIIIILLTLGCLCIWNRKWKQQQQKAEVLSSRSYNSNQTFSYMGNMMNSNSNPYHLTMEDRMRWAHISDVIKNISVQPNPELQYMPPSSSTLEQAAYSNRCAPSEDELSWYECRSRPRSRVMAPYGGVSGPSCFEMDISSRGAHYGGANYHNSKRHKHTAQRY